MFQANSIQHSQKIATNVTHICDHGCRLWSEWDLHGFKRTIWPVNGTLPSLLTVLFTSQVLIKSVIELRWESGVWTPQNRRVLGEQRSWCLALLKSDCGCIRHMADYFQRIFEWEQECVSKYPLLLQWSLFSPALDPPLQLVYLHQGSPRSPKPRGQYL